MPVQLRRFSGDPEQSHFDISSSGHFWQILKTKNLEIVYYYCAFCSLKSTNPNLNLSAKNVKLFMREP